MKDKIPTNVRVYLIAKGIPGPGPLAVAFVSDGFRGILYIGAIGGSVVIVEHGLVNATFVAKKFNSEYTTVWQDEVIIKEIYGEVS